MSCADPRSLQLPRSDSVSSSAANTSNLSMFSDEQLEQEILKRELAKVRHVSLHTWSGGDYPRQQLNAEPPPGPAPNDTINPAQLQLPSPPTMYDPNPFPYAAAGDIAVPALVSLSLPSPLSSTSPLTSTSHPYVRPISTQSTTPTLFPSLLPALRALSTPRAPRRALRPSRVLPHPTPPPPRQPRVPALPPRRPTR